METMIKSNLKAEYLSMILLIISFWNISCVNQTEEKQKQKDKSNEVEQEQVLSISFHTTGGTEGGSMSLAVTIDSIQYYHHIATDNGSFRKYNDITSPNVWDKLLNSCDLSLFTKVKSQNSFQEADGTDTTYSIITNEKKHSFTNGKGEAYNQLKDFLIEIQNLADECHKRATIYHKSDL